MKKVSELLNQAKDKVLIYQISKLKKLKVFNERIKSLVRCIVKLNCDHEDSDLA